MKKTIFGFILGVIVTTIIGVFAVDIYKASDIEFESKDENWKVTNVQDAIDDIKNNYYSRSVIKGILSKSEIIWDFEYTGSYQTLEIPFSATYKLETWGAQGGDMKLSYKGKGGKGGYSTGEVHLEEGQKVYIYVGGAGIGYQGNNIHYGGWNGGGDCKGGASGGGGATDISLKAGDWDSDEHLYSRIIVAGGGGGSNDSTNGGAGGGTNGLNGVGASNGATQTSGGKDVVSGSFGKGASYNSSQNDGGAGGGGWYGGGKPSGTNYTGGGGSGYVFTESTAANAPEGYTVLSDMYLKNAKTIAGNTSIPSITGGTETGHSGNGYAKITLISID